MQTCFAAHTFEVTDPESVQDSANPTPVLGIAQGTDVLVRRMPFLESWRGRLLSLLPGLTKRRSDLASGGRVYSQRLS